MAATVEQGQQPVFWSGLVLSVLASSALHLVHKFEHLLALERHPGMADQEEPPSQAAIDGTEQGRELAAKTRQAAKRKHDEVVREPSLVPIKKRKQPKSTSIHQVARPEGFDEAALTFDPTIHGKHGIDEPRSPYRTWSWASRGLWLDQ